MVATGTRVRNLFERAELFIGLGACDKWRVCASNFPGDVAARGACAAPEVTRLDSRSLFFESASR